MKIEENKSFIFKNKRYYLKVDAYEDTKYLKVSMKDEKSKEVKEITMKGVELVFPPAPTPDCVMVNNEKDKELIEKLIELKVLDYCNSIFAKFNINKLYEYDKQGTMKFLDYHATKVEYEDKGNSINEVKNSIEKEVKEILKDNKELLSEKYDFNNGYSLCSLINNANPKLSFAICTNEKQEYVLLVRPYIKNKSLKLKIVDGYNFNFDDHFFRYIQNEYEIGKVCMQAHDAIWSQIGEWYPYDINYKNGVQKYLKYCKKNNITKEKIEKKCGTKITDNIMKYYLLDRKKNNKER